jgi:hypothetical protein
MKLKGLNLAVAVIAFVVTRPLAASEIEPVTTKCVQSDEYRAARLLYADGVGAVATRQLLKARDYFDGGIKRLGYSYLTVSTRIAVMDDTGQHLSLAFYYHLHGNLLGEVKEKEGTLASRLDLYRWSHNCEKRN